MTKEPDKIATADVAQNGSVRITSLPPTLRGGFQIHEAADYLGVAEITVRRLVQRGLLKPNRKIRHWILPVKELNRFLEGE
jgi:excisionase family DNA binding protein